MPEVTTCPDCDKKLKVPDNLLGKKVRCPGCGEMFLAKADGAEDQEDEEPEKKKPAKSKARADSISDRKGSPARRGREDEEEEDDRPSKRSRREEDDRPSKKARRDEEEERPSKKARREEEDEDRPSKRSRRDEDEDEDNGRSRARGVKRAEDLDDRPSKRSLDDDRPSRRSRDDEYDDDRSGRRSRRDEEDEDYPRGPSRSAEVSGWRGTRFGVFLVVIANWIFMGIFGVGFIGAGIGLLAGGAMINSLIGGGMDDRSAASGMIGMGILLIIFYGLIGLMYLAYIILNLVGQGLCMQVPNLRGSALRPLAIAAFSCALGGLLIGWGGAFVRGGQATGSVGGLLNLAAFICWILFLRAVAVEMGDSDLAWKLIMYMISIFVFFFLATILLIIVFCGGFAAVGSSKTAEGAATGIGVMMVVMIILYAILLVAYLCLIGWFTMLMQQVRGAIAAHVARS